MENKLDPKQYFEFTEWTSNMQIPRVLGESNIHFSKWTLTDNHGYPVYLTTKELFKHYLTNKTLTIVRRKN